MPDRQARRAAELQAEADMLKVRRVEGDDESADERKGMKPRDRVWGLLIGLGVVVALLGVITIDTNRQAERNGTQTAVNRETGWGNRAVQCSILQTRIGVEAMREGAHTEELCFNDEVRSYYDPGELPRSPADVLCGVYEDLAVPREDTPPGCLEDS
jgi:hypothetical protein